MRTRPPLRTRSHRGSLVPADRYSVDEVLIVGSTIKSANSNRLAVGLRDKPFGAHVRHPDLHKAEALLTHALSMCTDAIPYSHNITLHVTNWTVNQCESRTFVGRSATHLSAPFGS